MSWSTALDIESKVRRRWTDGSVLRAYAAGEPFPRIDVPLKGPRPAEIGERLGEVQEWIAALRAASRSGSRFRLELTGVGGRLIGRNELPSRAIVESYEQVWALLRATDDVARLDQAVAASAGEPVVRSWVCQHPLEAISLHGQWEKIVGAYRWLDDHRGSGRHLREIAAPGVDTKFAEGHRRVLGQLLGVSTTSTGFVSGLGLRARPAFTRLRPAPELALLPPATELAVRHDELSLLDLDVRRAVIVENEITYLSVPVPPGGVVVWGRGFDVDRAGALPWLRGADVAYWGDLDTHGFAILHRLRARLPQTRSFLMDRETLVAHRDRWGTEAAPTSARLQHLTADESAAYTDLVEDRLGPNVRLEQERIDWTWATDRFPFA